MSLQELVRHHRRQLVWHEPKLQEGYGVTPRHRHVANSRRTLAVIDPQVPVWTWQLRRRGLLLVVAAKRSRI